MSTMSDRSTRLLLLASVFAIATCGLIYELIAGTLASYLLGDSILQFSTVIGTYLFAMGVGSWLSRYLERQLVAQFLRIELLVGLIGGLMPAALFALQSLATPSFRFALYALVLAVGILVGLEIPLVMRILKRHAGGAGGGLKTLVSQVLTFDYLGALAVAIAFPLLLVPQLGLVRTGALFGLMNAGVALWALWLFRGELAHRRSHALACLAVTATLTAAMVGADALTSWAEDRFYGDHVIVRESSDYQRVVVTAGPTGVRLFLNGNLQFHSRDEYRYHEALVHPALEAAVEKSPTDANMVALTQAYLRTKQPEKAQAVKWEVLPADGTLNIDPELTEWAAAELFRNAFRHDLAGDEVQAQASVEGDWFTLSIREAKAEEVDPAQWTQPLQKMSHGHYGLGLHRVRRIIAAQGGELTAKFDSASRTLTSTITLPCSTESP
jgi:hypothetical protein